MKALGCVSNRVLDAKMATMAIPIDRGNEIVLNFIFLEQNDIWRKKKYLENFQVVVFLKREGVEGT